MGERSQDGALSVPSELARLSEALLCAESSIALLSHCTPNNFSSEVSRCKDALCRGKQFRPDFRYSAPSPRFFEAQAALSSFEPRRLRGHPPPWDTVQELLVERAWELKLEARMVGAVGTPLLRSLSRERFPFTDEELSVADTLAEDWLKQEKSSPSCPQRGGERRLSLALRARARRAGLDVVVVERDIASLCAVSADGVIARRGFFATEEVIERLFTHEVMGHLLPRVRARSLPPPYAAGTRGASADEEGRALLLEDRHGLMLATRRRHLSVRHLLARDASRDAQYAFGTALRLVRAGHAADEVASIYCRVERASGLAREVVYLPSYLRVKKAFAEMPVLDAYLASGCVSIEAARKLAALDFPTIRDPS